MAVMTRTLQAELKRVGCYRGAIDGDWGPMSRRAMAEFASRVNASLSVDRPDPLLLRMVQGHQGQACSSAAYVAIRDQPRRENAEPPPGRMSVGGPLVDAGEQAQACTEPLAPTTTRRKRDLRRHTISS